MGDHDVPPKLTPKTVDVSKRVSYLMELEATGRGPSPMPRPRKRSMDLEKYGKANAVPSSVPPRTSLSRNAESSPIDNGHLQKPNIIEAPGNEKPSPKPRPRPRPRTRIQCKSPSTTQDPKDPQITEQTSDSCLSPMVQFQSNDKEDHGSHHDAIASISVNEVFSEDPFKAEQEFSSNNGRSSVLSENDNDSNLYIFPDGAHSETEVNTSAVSFQENKLDGMKFEEREQFSDEMDSAFMNNTSRNDNVHAPESSLSTVKDATYEGAPEPITPRPFDLKPFVKPIPFEETSFIQDSAKPQPQASLRFSDLLDFDPLAEWRGEKKRSDESVNVKTNNDGTLSLDAPVPIPDRSQSPNEPVTPGAYITLPMTEENLSSLDKAMAKSSLEYSPSFHFDPPEGPPPPLPKMPVTTNRDSIPPPVPPRPRQINISPMPSHRSSPSGSLGTSSDVSTHSSPPPSWEPEPVSLTSACLDELPTPVFAPLEDDPFSGSDFSTVCHTFNQAQTLPNSSVTSDAAAGSAAASAAVSTPSPAGPAPASIPDQDFEVDFKGAFGGQSSASTVDPFEECHDPERISRFVIPPPGSMALGKGLFPGMHGEYDLAQELSSTDESDISDDHLDSDRPMWTTPPSWPQDVTLVSSGSLQQKKTTRYGYLYKQGGYNANKGWKKRWVVFNGNSLSYYDSNTSQVSKRIVPVACMKDVATDVKPTERHSFKFKVVTTLKDRVFIFSAETLEDCLTWASSLMAAITEYKKSHSDSDDKPPVEKPDKEGFIKFNAMKRYYVVMRGHTMSYYQSFEDFEMESPIHEIDMKLASVKVKDKRKFKLQLWLHYGHFDLNLDSETDMQSWRMAIEDSIAEGLADDTVLEKVYQNLSNQQCADCGDKNPHWASINMGIVLCKNCAGVHRMFDYRVSKVRSLRMDTRVWTPSLIELMVTIGNANSNAFWESKLSVDAKIQPEEIMDKRKMFISQKYLQKKYCQLHPLATERPLLGEELLKVASSDNVLEAMHVLFSGADILFRKDDGQTAYEVAKDLGQRLVMELLYQNGGDPQSIQENVDDENRLREDVRLQGYLNKAGPGGRTFEKRWCILEHGTLTYYQSEKSPTAKGCIDRKNMLLIQNISLDRPGHHFDISTDTKDQRNFTFSSDSEKDACEWVRTIAKLMSPVAIMEHVGMLDIKFAGYAHLKISLQSEWQQTFLIFIWRGLYYMNKDLKLDYLDLRKASSIKLQEPENGCQFATEKGPCFVIGFSGKSVYVQAPLVRDTERIFEALESAAKCSGTTLLDQVLTSENVPVIIDKCITHISIEGSQETGIYRQSAQMSKVDNLLREFRKDATAVTFSNFDVHEVANALKKFLRELDDSVFERVNYPLWMRSSALKDERTRLMWYKYYLDKMSQVNYSTLKRIILHLVQVSRYSDQNQMIIQNLATCFAPSLMRTLSDEAKLMSDIPSREINVIIDLLTHHQYFFQLNDEDEIKKAEEIENAEMEIKRRLKSEQEGNQEAALKSILIPVHMGDPDGQATNISVTETLKVKQAMEMFRKSKAISCINANSFGMCELIFKGSLVRPLLPDELLNTTIKRWMEWEDWVKTDNSISLCAREMDILNKLDEHSKSSANHVLLSRLQYREVKSRRFKKTTIGFRQCRLALYSNTKASDEIVSWPVENLIFYFGHSAKKSPPTRHCLTFLVEGEKCSKTQGIFGHSISFDTDDELYRWASAFFLAQNPKGLLAWSSRS